MPPPPPPVPTTIETSVNSAIMYTFKLGSVDGYSAKRNFFPRNSALRFKCFPFFKAMVYFNKILAFSPNY